MPTRLPWSSAVLLLCGIGCVAPPAAPPREGALAPRGDRTGSTTSLDSEVEATNAAWTVDGFRGVGAIVSIGNAGDVDGDGYDDVIVGAVGDEETAGSAYVYAGSASGPASTPTTTLASEGSDGDEFGTTVAGVGDLDGDGYGDVLVGAPGDGSSQGVVYVYHGSAEGLSTSASEALDDGDRTSMFGVSIAAAGDVDADGLADVIIGGPYYGGGTDKGRAYLYYGSASGLEPTPPTKVTGSSDNSYTGYAVAGAGDVNADGYADVVVGAWGYNASQGTATVHLGSATGLSPSAATTLLGETGLDRFGWAVAGIGDADDDGYDDIVVGAPHYDGNRGGVYLYPGSSSGTKSTATQTWTRTSPGEMLGTAVSAAGDLNGDGYADLALAATEASPAQVEIYTGSASGPGTTPALTLDGDATADSFGGVLAAAGDVNGDGYGDLAVAAPDYSSGTDSGRASVYLGTAAGLTSTAGSTWAGSEGSAEQLGAAVAVVGDVNGDGYDDVVAGAPDSLYTNGQAYLYAGSADGIATTATTTLPAQQDEEAYGYSVSAAGDVNGDGYADVVIGAPEHTNAYLYLGSASGLATTPDTSFPHETSSITYGDAVAGAGDVDGDGYDDVLVGDSEFSIGKGAIWVYSGSATGVDTAAALDLKGTETNFAYAFDGAGDVNQDGFDDIAVATASRSSSTHGLLELFLGGSGGLSSGPDSSVTAEDSSGCFGCSLAGVGDVDGDGYPDIVVGQTTDELVHLYTGGATGFSATPLTTLSDSAAYLYGFSVDAAGDVNADGFADVIIGCDTVSTPGDADVYVGSATGLDPSPLMALVGEVEGDNFGFAVAGGGDVNGDGYDDVFVGAPYVDGRAGALYGFAGSVGDRDLDGIASDVDCDDENSAVGTVVPRYADADGDGYGAGSVTDACPDDPAFADTGDDCDDADGEVHPGAVEYCNGWDDNCDGDIDGDAVADATWYADGDGDGFGGSTATTGCAAPVGYVRASTDCDDGDADVHPGATERCNDLDDDCDGTTDVGAVDETTWYTDADGDGDGAAPVNACDAPAGTVATGTDCDDDDPSIYLGAPEFCDEVDQDCDGVSDNDAVDKTEWHADEDGDHYGGSTVTAACEQPEGHVTRGDDCDDTDPAINPGEDEVCDGADNDCDGTVDIGAEDEATWYVDGDGDGDGAEPVEACEQPAGTATTNTDCDDADPAVHAGATEVCNGVDDDCEGTVDVNAADPTTWYEDEDEDAWGGEATVADCVQPDGYVNAGGDCDDSNPAVHPYAEETCNEVDDNCNGAVDTDAVDRGTWYEDADSDGYGGMTVTACSRPAGSSNNGDDCDDNDGDTHPGATEFADDGIDQDCDGEDDVTKQASDGCGCATGRAPAGLLMTLAIFAMRRRSRPHRRCARGDVAG